MLLDEVLNEQTRLLWEWRTKLINLLTQSLSADSNDSENADGKEYSRTLDTQGEAETFLQALAAIMADRREGSSLRVIACPLWG
jgi:E3 ubiquitin-protein ligase SHPRH